MQKSLTGMLGSNILIYKHLEEDPAVMQEFTGSSASRHGVGVSKTKHNDSKTGGFRLPALLSFHVFLRRLFLF